jgi:uncharacterized membrane protein
MGVRAMPMSFAAYFVALAIFLVIDGVWLSIMGRMFYAKEIGHLLLERPNFFVAGLFYMLLVFGLLVLVILPALAERSLAQAATRGALFGLVAYATYDLTNLATIKGFTARVAIVDMAWGAVLAAVVCSLTYIIISRW